MWVLILLFANVNTEGKVVEIRPQSVPGFTSDMLCAHAGERVKNDTRVSGIWWGPRVTYSCVKQ